MTAFRPHPLFGQRAGETPSAASAPSVVEFGGTRNGAVWEIEVEDFPASVVGIDKGNDLSRVRLWIPRLRRDRRCVLRLDRLTREEQDRVPR